MIGVKNIFKRLSAENKAGEVRSKVIAINPSPAGVYVDMDGTAITPYSDTIEKKEFNWARGTYSFVVPGLMEWYARYLQHLENPEMDFDWKGWHRDGLLFTKQIYLNLPRCIPVQYVVPPSDASHILESFDVTEENIDSLLAMLDDPVTEREPLITDRIIVGVKEEDGDILMRLTVKGKNEEYTFQMEYETLKYLKEFLEDIALKGKPIPAWESKSSENGIYFYPQTISNVNHMGQLHIFSEGELVFSAYINSRNFVRSVYRSIMIHVESLKDKATCKLFKSNILECYIDDERYEHISFFRKNPMLANFIEPAIENVRNYFHDMYDSIFDENEYV